MHKNILIFIFIFCIHPIQLHGSENNSARTHNPYEMMPGQPLPESPLPSPQPFGLPPPIVLNKANRPVLFWPLSACGCNNVSSCQECYAPLRANYGGYSVVQQNSYVLPNGASGAAPAVAVSDRPVPIFNSQTGSIERATLQELLKILAANHTKAESQLNAIDPAIIAYNQHGSYGQLTQAPIPAVASMPNPSERQPNLNTQPVVHVGRASYRERTARPASVAAHQGKLVKIDEGSLSDLFTRHSSFEADKSFVDQNFSRYDALSRLQIIRQLCKSKTIIFEDIIQLLEGWIPLMPESSMNILDPKTGQALCHMLTPIHHNRDLIGLAISRGVNFVAQTQRPDRYKDSTVAHNVAGLLRNKRKLLQNLGAQRKQELKKHLYNGKWFIMLCFTLWPQMKHIKAGQDITIMDIIDCLKDKRDINTALERISQEFSGDSVGQLSQYEKFIKFNEIFDKLFGHRKNEDMLIEKTERR